MSAAWSSERLRRMHDVLSGHIGPGGMPGLVALVSRRGEVHVDVIGAATLGGTQPMRRDTLFRIASLTKPVTAAAAMMLIEECRIRLDDSIEPWLPELANRRVLKRIDCELDDTVSANRAITVRDLLTFRLGFGSVMQPPGTYPIQRALSEARLGGDGPPRPSLAPTGAEWIRGLGALPLMYQPGERWLYNTGSDVLGILIERVTGQSLGTFLRERFFDPLGMRDTAFGVPADKLHRLSDCVWKNHQTGALEPYDSAANSSWSGTPPFESGAGGLVSTADDYAAFSHLLLNYGRHGKQRLLSRPSIELMMSDQVTPAQRQGAELFFGNNSSWGFGGAVNTFRDELWSVPGRYGWTGGLGSSGYSDPREQLAGVLLTTRMMESPQQAAVFLDFWNLAYQAIDD